LDPRLIAAHRALRSGGDIQFRLMRAPPPAEPPAWLSALGRWLRHTLAPVGRFFRWIGGFLPDAPYARILLWTVIAVLAAMLIAAIYTRIREGEWRLPRFRRRKALQPEDTEEIEWTPEGAPARAWLDEADRLAAQGQFGDAVHHLLLRSVEDIARRRPQLVRPALTSRDLARATSIPAAPRRLFADLAAVVERSLFGGGTVSSDDWGACRAAYADFARARSWQG
jgi:hypothetical protein